MVAAESGGVRAAASARPARHLPEHGRGAGAPRPGRRGAPQAGQDQEVHSQELATAAAGDYYMFEIVNLIK